jgi:hypothetical protein
LDAAGTAVTRIAAAATATAVTRATLPRSAAATSDGFRADGFRADGFRADGFRADGFRAAEGGLRCREAAPAWPGDDRGGLRDTGRAFGWTATPRVRCG